MDKAHYLTQMLAEEMAAYSQTRQAGWYETLGAEIFLECMEDLTEVQGLLDDLRSNF